MAKSKKTTNIIKLISHPDVLGIRQARLDQAHITGQDIVERPWWYENTETGKLYHDIYSCIGWPSEVSDRGRSMPGYAAIVGIVRPSDSMTHYNPVNASFQLLDEVESRDVPTLLDMCLKMREKWGYGVQRDLLTMWYGDCERFETVLALRNDLLVKRGGEKARIIVTPSDDFYTPGIFDNYVRAIQSCLIRGKKRFFFGDKGILKVRLKKFRRDDPAALAMGGLVHTLLCRSIWMDTLGGNAFNVENEW